MAWVSCLTVAMSGCCSISGAAGAVMPAPKLVLTSLKCWPRATVVLLSCSLLRIVLERVVEPEGDA